MSVTITPGPAALLKNKALRFATCWQITRTDATVLRFTDHDRPIIFGGNTYAPAGGFRASARQKEAGLREKNLEIIGTLTSGAITHSDLRAGRYREAEVWEYLIDWLYPWAGALASSRYWIAEIRYTGEEWEARVEGLTRWLRLPIGRLYGRTCGHILGDTACGINLDAAAYKEAGTVDDVTSAGLDKRRVFEATGMTKADDFFSYGYVTWTGGANNGLTGEVKDYTLASGKVELQNPLPYDLVVTDTFDIRAGCDKLAATCKDKFSNLIQFGGFNTIPGNDRMFQTPIR